MRVRITDGTRRFGIHPRANAADLGLPGYAGTYRKGCPMEEQARPLTLRLRDGRAWQGVEFADGFVYIHHPGEPNLCTIALSIDALLADRHAQDPMHGASVERPKTNG